MTMTHVVKVAGRVCPVRRINGRSIDMEFFGHPATYWPGKKTVVLRNPIDGKFLALRNI